LAPNLLLLTLTVAGPGIRLEIQLVPGGCDAEMF
jgi:hypothetical protein